MESRIFALEATGEFGEKVAQALGRELDPHEEREFEDGEYKVRPLVSVRGRECFVIQSLHGGPRLSPDDKICRLLFFARTLHEHGAERITAVIPYLAYARKDRMTKPRDPVTLKYLAILLEAAGIHRVVGLVAHNIAAFHNAFRIPTVHLDTRHLFAGHVENLLGAEPVVVASPDPGGVKRAQLFRETLAERLGREVGGAYLEKRRSAGQVSGHYLAGEVKGATVLVLDDLISSGGTLVRAARTCLDHGAAAIWAYAAHGLFMQGADQAMGDSSLDRIIVTDSIPPFRLSEGMREKIEIVSVAPLFARAMQQLHNNDSIVELTS